MEKWKTLETKYIIRRPWLTARVDKVQLPSGVINPEHYVLEYPDWVNVIAITTDGLYVLIRQYRHGLDEIGVELCAGVSEVGEDPETAARRELLEETGYAGGQWSMMMKICQNPSTCNNFTYCFVARGVERVSDQQLDDSEDIEVLLLSRDELLHLLQSGEMTQALMLAPLWRHICDEAL